MKKLFLLTALAVYSQVFAFEVTNKNIGDLKFDKTNPTVKTLQVFLNENGFNKVDVGPGSPEHETEYFGEVTVAAVKIFQEHSGIPVTGKIDFETGKAINKYTEEILEEEEKIVSEISNEEKVGGRYNTGLDIYTNDVTDIYIDKKQTISIEHDHVNTRDAVNTPTIQKKSLKDILESSSKKQIHKSSNQENIFKRFFSLFE